MRNGEAAKNENRIKLARGKYLWLDDPETVLQVAAGTVDVYAVASTGDGQRQQVFLFEAREGQTLFGVPPAESDGKVKLMILGPGEAVLKRMTRSELLAKAAQGNEYILEAVWFMLEGWLEAILSATVAAPPPRSFVPLGAGESLTAQAGQLLRPRKNMIWVRAESGDVHYGLLPDYLLAKEEIFPLLSGWWLAADNAAGLRGMATEEVFSLLLAQDQSSFWQPLARCHQLFGKLIERHFSDHVRRDNERLEARRQQREKLLCDASVQLLRNDVTDLPVVVNSSGVSSPIVNLVRAVAVHLGVPEQEVRLPAGADPLRQDTALLRSTVRLAGMELRQVYLEPGWQGRDNGPLIGFWKAGGSMVALLPVSPGKYSIYDPGHTETVMVDEETAGLLDAVAYTIYAGLPGDLRTLSGFLTFLVKKCWPGDLWTLLLIALLAGVIPILTPFVTQTIFEDIIPINDRQGLVMVVQVMMVAAFATAGVSFARGATFLRIKSRSRLAGEAALWLRLLSLPVAFFRRFEAGDLAQRMQSISQIAMLVSHATVSALFNALFSFWSLLVMLYYSWQLTLVAGAVWLIYIAVTVFLQWGMVAVKRRMMEAAGETAGQVLQIFNGLSKFRMQGAEAQAFFLWARLFGEQWKWNRAFRWKSNWLELINTLQPLLLTMLTYWLTMHWLKTEGTATQTAFITMPEFMAFNSAFTGFNATISGLIAMSTNFLEIVPQLERIRPILETAPEVTEDKAEAGELSGRIEVNNVSFRYGPDMPPVLRNVSINVLPGQFVAIVGSSGSGKSTLLRLLLGFDKPDAGSIYFDGQDLAEVNVTSVRTQMGVVLQNGQLMAGDILSNIIGSLPLTIDDAWQAAEMVGLADDIRAMPMGMHTVISEGASNISGGQRQRILIARAIVHRPRIIVFDEATSALDNKTQGMVTDSLDLLNATRIVVAHRLSTVINADLIYVLDKGEIAESGTYAELMAAEGLFAALARRQMA